MASLYLAGLITKGEAVVRDVFRSYATFQAEACDFVITYDKFYKWMSDSGLQDGGIVTGDCSILFQTYASSQGRFLDLKAFTKVLGVLAGRRDQAAQREAAFPFGTSTRPSTAPQPGHRRPSGGANTRDEPLFTPAAAAIACLTFRHLPSALEIHEGEDLTCGVRKGITVYPMPRPPPPKVTKTKKRPSQGDGASAGMTSLAGGNAANGTVTDATKGEPPGAGNDPSLSRRNSKVSRAPGGAVNEPSAQNALPRASSQRGPQLPAETAPLRRTSLDNAARPSEHPGAAPSPRGASQPSRDLPFNPSTSSSAWGGLSPRNANTATLDEAAESVALKPSEMPALLRETLRVPANIPPTVTKVLVGVTALEKRGRHDQALAALSGAGATWRVWVDDHSEHAGGAIGSEGETYLALLRAGLLVSKGQWDALERTLEEAESAAADMENDAHEYHVVIASLLGSLRFHEGDYRAAHAHFARAAELQRSSLLVSLATQAAAGAAVLVQQQALASSLRPKSELTGNVAPASTGGGAASSSTSKPEGSSKPGTKSRAASLTPSASTKGKASQAPSMPPGTKGSGSSASARKARDVSLASSDTATLSSPRSGGSTPRLGTVGSFAEPDGLAGGAGMLAPAAPLTVPPEHGDVLLAVLDNNAGCCLHVMGDRRRALPLYQDAKVALVAKLGSGHPSTLTAIQNGVLVRRMMTMSKPGPVSPREDPGNNSASLAVPVPMSPLLGASRPPAISSYYLKPVGTKGKMVLTLDQPVPPPVTKSKKKGEEVPIKKAPPTTFLYTPHYGTPAGGTFGPKKRAPASPPKKK